MHVEQLPIAGALALALPAQNDDAGASRRHTRTGVIAMPESSTVPTREGNFWNPTFCALPGARGMTKWTACSLNGLRRSTCVPKPERGGYLDETWPRAAPPLTYHAGYLHGSVALSDGVIFLYDQSALHDPAASSACASRPDLGVAWPSRLGGQFSPPRRPRSRRSLPWPARSVTNAARAGRPPVESLPLTDEELIVRVREGERELFAVLVERYKRGIANFIGASLRDAPKSPISRRKRSCAPTRTWERSIRSSESSRPGSTRSRVTSCAPISGRTLRRPVAQPLAEEQTLENSLPDLSREADPAGGVLRDEAERELRAALAELPERTRTVLALRYFDNMEYHTIASTLGLSLGNVKTLIHRGKIALAKKMRESRLAPPLPWNEEGRVRCSSCEPLLDRYVEASLDPARASARGGPLARVCGVRSAAPAAARRRRAADNGARRRVARRISPNDVMGRVRTLPAPAPLRSRCFRLRRSTSSRPGSSPRPPSCCCGRPAARALAGAASVARALTAIAQGSHVLWPSRR